MFEKIRYNEQSAFWDGTFCLSGTVFFAEKFRLFVVIKSRLNEFWLVCIFGHFDWIDLIFRIFQKEFVLWPKKKWKKRKPRSNAPVYLLFAVRQPERAGKSRLRSGGPSEAGWDRTIERNRTRKVGRKREVEIEGRSRGDVALIC